MIIFEIALWLFISWIGFDMIKNYKIEAWKARDMEKRADKFLNTPKSTHKKNEKENIFYGQSVALFVGVIFLIVGLVQILHISFQLSGHT